MKKITVKDLIGVSKLTLDQAIKYFEHPNYMLKGSEMVIMDNETIDPEKIISGTLNAISDEGEISFVADGECVIQTVSLEEKILIVFPKELPAQAIFFK